MGSGLTFFGRGSSHEQQPVVTDSDSLSELNKSSKACKMTETCTQDSERLKNKFLIQSTLIQLNRACTATIDSKKNIHTIHFQYIS